MATVTIYTTTHCPYCVQAKMLLQKKNVAYQEIDATDPNIREEMILKAGGKRTVPQIFINGQHIGGCDDMYALDSQGKLDGLLSQK